MQLPCVTWSRSPIPYWKSRSKPWCRQPPISNGARRPSSAGCIRRWWGSAA